MSDIDSIHHDLRAAMAADNNAIVLSGIRVSRQAAADALAAVYSERELARLSSADVESFLVQYAERRVNEPPPRNTAPYLDIVDTFRAQNSGWSTGEYRLPSLLADEDDDHDPQLRT